MILENKTMDVEDSIENYNYMDETYHTGSEEDVKTTEIDDFSTGVVVNCKKAYIRSSPAKDSTHISIVSNGDELLIEEILDGWYKITTQTGLEGYIMQDLVKLD